MNKLKTFSIFALIFMGLGAFASTSNGDILAAPLSDTIKHYLTFENIVLMAAAIVVCWFLLDAISIIKTMKAKNKQS